MGAIGRSWGRRWRWDLEVGLGGSGDKELEEGVGGDGGEGWG